MKSPLLYTLTGLGFIFLAMTTSFTNLTGYTIASSASKTNILSLILLLTGLFSLTIGINEKIKSRHYK